MKLVDHHGIEFCEITGGSFLMGLSEREESEALLLSEAPPLWWDALRPTRVVTVPAYRISSAPVMNRDVIRVAPQIAARADLVPDSAVARLEYVDAIEVARKLGGRLPSEVEWEYACRGGTKGLFTFGALPETDQELEPWMTSDGLTGARNAFGLRSLFTGEWCRDPWKLSYWELSEIDPSAHTLRGGGAQFWPWQDEEWVWCISAGRFPSTEAPDTREWSFRLVLGD